MSRFSLRLHYATGRQPDDEPLDALDEVEARELARMRLLLTRDYSEIELRRGDRRIEAFQRDPH
ncbi:MAG: hypothetical protein EON89_06415 [Brevundimonas sp.]|nr:MAG: hypothetical protein EON89_06415 [Brevundimonas sp.]